MLQKNAGHNLTLRLGSLLLFVIVFILKTIFCNILIVIYTLKKNIVLNMNIVVYKDMRRTWSCNWSKIKHEITLELTETGKKIEKWRNRKIFIDMDSVDSCILDSNDLIWHHLKYKSRVFLDCIFSVHFQKIRFFMLNFIRWQYIQEMVLVNHVSLMSMFAPFSKRPAHC